MRRLPLLLAAALVSMLSSVLVLADQAPGGRSTTGAKVRLTADGQPDLQGFWTNDTYTPLERPVELGDKALFTPEEAAAFFKSKVDDLHAQAANDIHYDDAIWQAENYEKVASRRTSLIVDPPNGRLPPLTAQGEDRLPRQRAAQRATSANSAKSRSLGERCISWGNVGPPMMPPTYNANLQILQTPNLVMIRHEMMHDVRTVYLDGRPHPPPNVQWLAGHSIGRFEGDTLVVDTTNFLPGFLNFPIPHSDKLHVVERFTLDPQTMKLTRSYTVEDPVYLKGQAKGQDVVEPADQPYTRDSCKDQQFVDYSKETSSR